MNTITKESFSNIPSILRACLAAALVSSASVSAQTYTVTPINPPAGTDSCVAQSLNNLGGVVGYTRVKAGKNYALGPAFIWKSGQSTTLMPLSGQPSAEATRISDSGLIVGGPNLLSNLETGRATWWEKTSTGYQPRDWNALLPAGSGLTLLRADALSHDGRYISFQAEIGATGLRDIVAEIELDSTGPLPLGIVRYWDVTDVWGVTDIHHDGAGLVRATGLGGPDVDTPGAFLWVKSPDGTTQLIDRHSSADQVTGAWAVNGLGELAGFRRNSSVDRAVYWDQSGIMQDIGTLGGSEAVANSINDGDYVVGWALTARRNAPSHAFLWHSSTGMRDLNVLKSTTDTSGVELTSAAKINNAGQILALGASKSLGNVAVLLNPQ
ncbi:MAG: hypothetical protein DME26_10215 [Verrucomicrobia bacterium]|nr:MAG: hypothetical protein DME26_10215 [Verrucomicrobiota bacterium]